MIHSREERERVAALNLMAGKRAKASTAYAAALSYLAAGRALLVEEEEDLGNGNTNSSLRSSITARSASC